MRLSERRKKRGKEFIRSWESNLLQAAMTVGVKITHRKVEMRASWIFFYSTSLGWMKMLKSCMPTSRKEIFFLFCYGCVSLHFTMPVVVTFTTKTISFSIFFIKIIPTSHPSRRAEKRERMMRKRKCGAERNTFILCFN